MGQVIRFPVSYEHERAKAHSDLHTTTFDTAIPYQTKGGQNAAPASTDRDACGLVLRKILAGEAVKLKHQAQYDLRTGEVRALESFVRADLYGRRLDTAQFIKTAEQQNLMAELGYCITRQAIHEYQTLDLPTRNTCKLAINVSPLQLTRDDFASSLIGLIDGSALDFAEIELEITESASLDDPELKLDQLHNLIDRGVTLALDDFGTGHAGWSSIFKLPFNTLKLDRGLVSRMRTDSRAKTIVVSTIQAAQDIGMEVVAEGVCHANEMALLSQAGCQYGQGFGLALPLAIRDIDLTRLPLPYSASEAAR